MSTGGPLVILLHGAVANSETWLPLARAVAPDVELWCPDLPGHGAHRDVPFTLAAALSDVTELVARAVPRRPVLAGDSLGGYLALAAAARAGDAIAGVVAGGCTWTMTGVAGALARASDLPVAALTKLVGPARMLAFADKLVPRVTDAETAHAIVRAGLRLEARGESLRELTGFDLVATVREIRVPIAFVNGRYDWPTRAGERELLRAARDATLVIAPRCGHGVGILDPQTFARAFDLISRLERRRSNETDEADSEGVTPRS